MSERDESPEIYDEDDEQAELAVDDEPVGMKDAVGEDDDSDDDFENDDDDDGDDVEGGRQYAANGENGEDEEVEDGDDAEPEPVQQKSSLTALLLGDPNAADEDDEVNDEDDEDEEEDEDYVEEVADPSIAAATKKRSIDELDAGENGSQGTKKMKA